MPEQTHVGTSTVAQWCGVSRSAISKWIARGVDMPEPDVMIGGTRRQGYTWGWLPTREQEIRDWAEARHA